MDKFFLSIFAFLGWSLVCGSVGWYFHGHPDKLIQYTGFVGEYITSHWIEHKPICPSGYICTQPSQLQTSLLPSPSPTL